MIKLDKPTVVPDILQTDGVTKKNEHCSTYLSDPDKYKTRAGKFGFDNEIYGDKSVKKSLKTAQHNKCCFCESYVSHISHGDVEHFRPKAAFKNKQSEKMKRPGYYWLAYDWDNLLFSCELCNRKYKGNLFPLNNPGERARKHTDDISKEDIVFINPYNEDPTDHISFRKEVPFHLTDRGKKTISQFGLKRDELDEYRRKFYDKMKFVYIVAMADPPLPETPDAINLLNECQSSVGEYSLMITRAVENKFEDIPT